MSAQDIFGAELAAWLDLEATAPMPASALERALVATSTRRPRPSVVAGVSSHWIEAVPVEASGLRSRRSLPPHRVLVLALLALVAVALAGAAMVVGGWPRQGPAPKADQAWPGPVHPGVLPVQPLELGPAQPLAVQTIGMRAWTDDRDAPIDWLDITQVRVAHEGQARWHLELAAPPPRAEGLDAEETVISYGLVFDTTGDGRADYEVGINNDAPVRGDFRVWVTDLATGETDEQVGPPYGHPIEFRHPDEAAPGDLPRWSRTMSFSLFGSSDLSGLLGRSPFYAWSAVTRAGETVAWDYAPDAAWLGIPDTVAGSPASPAVGYGAPRLPGTSASPAGVYGWDGQPGEGAGMHWFPQEGLDSREAIAMRWSVGPDCLSVAPGAVASQEHGPVPVRLAGHDGIAIEPYLPPVGFSSGLEDATTRAYELAVGDRTLCLWLTWHETTTDEELDEADRILDHLRVEPLGDGRIRVMFTLGPGWDTG